MKKDLKKLASFLKESGNIKEYNRLLGLIKESKSPFELLRDVAGTGLEMAGGWLTSEKDAKYVQASIGYIIGEDFCKKINISFDEDLAESLQKGEDAKHSTKVSFEKIQSYLGSNADDQKKWESTKKLYKDEQEDFTINFVRNFSAGFGDRVDCEFTLTIDTNRQKYKVYLLEDAFYNNHLYVKTQYFDIDYEAEEEEQRKRREELERAEKDLQKQREEQEKEIKENEKILEKSRKSYHTVKRDSEEKKDDVFYYTDIDSDTNGTYYMGKDGSKLYLSEKQRKNIKVEEVK